MKHLLLLVVILAVGYGLWNLASPIERRAGVRLISRHVLRFGALLAVALALLVLAYFLPSINIL